MQDPLSEVCRAQQCQRVDLPSAFEVRHALLVAFAAALEALSVERSVESRASYGGTAPAQVREQVARWRKALGEGV